MVKILIITQIVYVLFAPVWVVIWMMSVMMFDSGVSWANSIVFALISIYPLAMIGCTIASWILYRKGRKRPSLYVDLVPGVWVVSLSALLIAVNVHG